MPTAINARRWRTSRTASADTRQTVAERRSTLESTYFPRKWGKYGWTRNIDLCRTHRDVPGFLARVDVFADASSADDRTGRSNDSSAGEQPERDDEHDQRDESERDRRPAHHRSDPRPRRVRAKSSIRSSVQASPKATGMMTASISTNWGTNGNPTTHNSTASSQLAIRFTRPG